MSIRVVGFFSWLSACTLIYAADSSVIRTYTLDTLLQIGLDNSREVKIVEQEMEKAEFQVREYYGKAFPRIDLSVNYKYAIDQFDAFAIVEANNPDIMDLMPSATFDMLSDVTETRKHSAALGISLTQPLFSQMKVINGLKIARLRSRSLLCKWQDTKMKVKARITRLFYQALLAGKNNEIQQHAIALASEAHQLAVIRLRMGTATELDTLNTRLNLESCRIAFQESIRDKRNALDALRKSTGVMDSVDGIALAGDFPGSDYTVSLEEALQYVRSENKQVVQLNVALQIQRDLVNLAKGEYFPLVYCGGSLGKITRFNTDDEILWQDDQAVFIGLTYNLFDGLQRHQKIRQARAEERAVQQSRELAVEGLELMTRSAWEELETARKKLIHARSLVELAERAYDVSKKAYELGTITLLDFQNSEQKVNGARLAMNGCLFEFHSSVVDMRLLLGDYLYEPEEKAGD